jgi:hypothetical protein
VGSVRIWQRIGPRSRETVDRSSVVHRCQRRIVGDVSRQTSVICRQPGHAADRKERLESPGVSSVIQRRRLDPGPAVAVRTRDEPPRERTARTSRWISTPVCISRAADGSLTHGRALLATFLSPAR